MSRITEKQISQLVKEVADLAGLANNKAAAVAANQPSYLSFENAACYGGYRLIMVGVNNGAHYGAFQWGSTEPRVKPAVFADRLNALIVGLEFNKR